MMTGIILKGIGGFYDVLAEGRIIRCRLRGRLRKTGITPAAGDCVRIDPGSSTIEGSIEEILPRKNFLIRPAVANVENLIIVIAAANPQPDLLLADKLLISAEYKGISSIIVINKVDLVEQDYLTGLEHEFSNTGYPCYCISASKNIGIEAMSSALKGITTLAGQSGVGKSSIINRLCPQLNLETGNISEKIQRGKHTTRRVELLVMPDGGMIADTPGFSQMDLTEFEPAELQDFYPDFKGFRDKCRFAGCMHHREPDCAVRNAVQTGEISGGRYQRYIKLIDNIIVNRRN